MQFDARMTRFGATDRTHVSWHPSTNMRHLRFRIAAAQLNESELDGFVIFRGLKRPMLAARR